MWEDLEVKESEGLIIFVMNLLFLTQTIIINFRFFPPQPKNLQYTITTLFSLVYFLVIYSLQTTFRCSVFLVYSAAYVLVCSLM